MASEKIERGVTAALVFVAVFLSGAAIRREIAGDQGVVRAAASDRPPERESRWETIVQAGVLVGDSAAPVRVLVFSDLECPYCKRFHDRFRALQRNVDDVALVFVHYPLDRHRFARPAARALECVGAFGRFEAFLDLVFEHQDSLGFKSFTSFASSSGVKDTVAFQTCSSDVAVVDRIERGLALGREIGVRGTPTVIINGWRYHAIPDDQQLLAAVSRIRQGQPPPGVNDE